MSGSLWGPADGQIMLFGYPVEMLCTYQYSLVSLMPGGFHCGSSDLFELNIRVDARSARLWSGRPGGSCDEDSSHVAPNE